MTVTADDRYATRPSVAAYHIPHTPTQSQPQPGRANWNSVVATMLLRAHRPFVAQQKQRNQKMHKKWKRRGWRWEWNCWVRAAVAAVAAAAAKKASPSGQPMSNSQSRLIHSAHWTGTKRLRCLSSPPKFSHWRCRCYAALPKIFGDYKHFLINIAGDRGGELLCIYNFMYACASPWLWSASKHKYWQI